MSLIIDAIQARALRSADGRTLVQARCTIIGDQALLSFTTGAVESSVYIHREDLAGLAALYLATDSEANDARERSGVVTDPRGRLVGLDGGAA